MADWNPNLYERFAKERRLPVDALVERLIGFDFKTILDLGCGAGASTEPLLENWPSASITGIDSSSAMLAKAKARLPQVTFLERDIGQLSTSDVEPADLVFSNALLHWLPNHEVLLPELMKMVKPGGWFAFQLPDNLAEPSHAFMGKVAREGRRLEKLKSASGARAEILSPEKYYETLVPFSEEISIWQTKYAHVVDGHDGIVNMLLSTGLKPYVDPLSEDERADYLESYRKELTKAYPTMPDGKVLLHFPRLFLIARKKT